MTIIFNLINKQNYAEIKKYIKNGGDINSPNKDGLSPLMAAIINGNMLTFTPLKV